MHLELLELLASTLILLRSNLQHVEADSLGQRSIETGMRLMMK